MGVGDPAYVTRFYHDLSIRFWNTVSVPTLAAFVFFFVCGFLQFMEAQDVHFMNTYAFLIAYGIGGGGIILVWWGIGTIAYMTKSNNLSWRHVWDINLAWLFSMVVFAINTWLLASWLARFGAGCCGQASGDPNKALPAQFAYFQNIMISGFVLQLVACYIQLRALISHYYPECTKDETMVSGSS